MEDFSDKYLLMCEPDQQGSPSDNPVEDDITKKVDALMKMCTRSDYSYRGVHKTKCGVPSDNHDLLLPNGMITHSLIGYYIRHYRDYIPQTEINKINRVYKEVNDTHK